MKNIPIDQKFTVLVFILRWLSIALAVGLLAGSASAFFLKSLDWATAWRESHLWIIALLPVSGFAVGWIYDKIGREAEKGNNLLLDEIHDPKAVIPLRMAPLIFISTILTHLFGGSAGREGTAVQMSGSLADQLSKPFKLSAKERRVLLMAGISAGFGSVFGTPLAGAIFGLEVLAIGKMDYEAIFPCLIAAVAGHEATLAWGIHHEAYSVAGIPAFSIRVIACTILAGALFGLMGRFFSRLTHGTQDLFKKRIPYAPLRPFVGGILVAGAVWLSGTGKYIGLGLETIQASFIEKLPVFDFLGKTLFTAVTLGSGFKGGEVTPLFYIGATLGNALSSFLFLPAAFLAGLGFVAVFAGAANTPITCTVLAIEIFGPEIGIYAGIACVVSYLFSGHSGIYHSQKIGEGKFK